MDVGAAHLCWRIWPFRYGVLMYTGVNRGQQGTATLPPELVLKYSLPTLGQ